MHKYNVHPRIERDKQCIVWNIAILVYISIHLNFFYIPLYVRQSTDHCLVLFNSFHNLEIKKIRDKHVPNEYTLVRPGTVRST